MVPTKRNRGVIPGPLTNNQTIATMSPCEENGIVYCPLGCLLCKTQESGFLRLVLADCRSFFDQDAFFLRLDKELCEKTATFRIKVSFLLEKLKVCTFFVAKHCNTLHTLQHVATHFSALNAFNVIKMCVFYNVNASNIFLCGRNQRFLPH